ncbi:hypothetical protein D3C71_1468490 [compost metagenome]
MAGRQGRAAQRKREYAELQPLLPRDAPLDSFDDRRVVAEAVLVQHFDCDNAGSGGGSPVLPPAGPAVARRVAGDMRAVPVVVIGPASVVHEILEGCDPVHRPDQVGMGIDACIEHGDADAPAVKSGASPDGGSTNGRSRDI